MTFTRKQQFAREHQLVTRRFMLNACAGLSLTAITRRQLFAAVSPELESVIAKLEPYFTPQDDFVDVSRGDPLPYKLPEDKKRAVGMSRDTWKLEVISDKEHPVDIRQPMTGDHAFTFPDLMELAKTKSVRVPKVMTCLNMAEPLGMGVWEGVPLRDLFWKTQPRKNIRRLFYYGYHNDKPDQMFRSSLPIDRILEDPGELPPVLLCYKLNDTWLTSERGGPVRVVVPEAYGFKSIKWLSHIVLTNLFHANDTYANGNNDVDSSLKTYAATLSVPKEVKAGQPIPVTGFAQVGPSGLQRVEVFVTKEDDKQSYGKYFANAPWQPATILPVPWKDLGGPMWRSGDQQREARPVPLTRIHWATLLDGLPAGDYVLRSRTVDRRGVAQPMPRPFRKSGHAAIKEVAIRVEA